MIALAMAAALGHVAASPLDQAFAYAPRLFMAQERDQFADIKEPAVTGKEFTEVARFADGNGYDLGPASYMYKDGTLTLSMSAPESFSDSNEIMLRSSDAAAKHSYIGRNAFGASARVTVAGRYIEALRPETAPDPHAGLYESVLKLSPSEAKTTALGARVVISGTIGGQKGALTECHDTHSAATIDDPEDLTIRTCLVRVRIHRIAFVRHDGSVIDEWTDPPNPASSAATASHP
jgi:hypothetical protein